MKKKVLVIGGLGFIGYHISEVMSRNGLKVTIAHRSPSSAQESQYDLLHLVLDTISKEDLRKVLMDFSYIIFCGGADDRKLPTGDALAFYYKENVVPCRKLVEAGNYSKVEKLIILGSYLTHFDRSVPEWKLKEKHPYIMSRYLQQVEPIDLAEGTLQVSIIEIPYVFGIAPGKVPLWKPLIDYISKSPIVIYTKGGTNIMSVEQLATAVYGVVNTEIYKQYWIVGSENVTWSMLIKMISAALRKRRKGPSSSEFCDYGYRVTC